MSNTKMREDGTIKLADQDLAWLKAQARTLLNVTRPGSECFGGCDFRKLVAVTSELNRRGYKIVGGKVV